ncbi:unnamed protein product, partial [marine sediment metagenome]
MTKQFGSTVASPTSGTQAFSGNLTVLASETVTLKAIADVPTSDFPVPNCSVAVASTTDTKDAVDSTGVSSSVDLDETGSAVGNLITISAGGLTVSRAATPGNQQVIVGATEL